eukprot:TRINITY_DN3082_c0_g1_i1.p1 TRINITY_DN3082_c0_g1~~TRINITY_DN3082_c0_g1_i1.p1  ORF type:complete len:563 (+),score=190.65 TRINITY_DN3082_c0_g1_i1:587-2275(+)
MLEVDCPAMLPEVVLKTSGHVDRFCDLMVKDVKTGDCFRADHLLEDVLKAKLEDKKNPPTTAQRDEYEQVMGRVDDYSKEELHEKLTQYGAKAPETGNDITEPFEFNLMFETQIGPTGKLRGFLRPETAQNIFVNYAKLYEQNGKRLPFAAAQIGEAFRNEIAPRSGLLRVRQFTMAEIEHFCHPDKKGDHPRFDKYKDYELPLFSREAQMTTRKVPTLSIRKAVDEGIISNETLAYFMARTHMFLINCGADPSRVRFRQHLKNEMAHYACDCWDAEIETSYGWIECVGHADRSAYDLTVHAKKSKIDLSAREDYPEPRMVEEVQFEFNKRALGMQFKKDSKLITAHFEEMPEDCLEEFGQKLSDPAKYGEPKIQVGDKEFTLTSELLTIAKKSVKKTGRNYTPHVIEPSFGIGRIIYCILEHSYHIREGDEQRGYLSLSPIIAPMKVAILPLANSHAEMNEIVHDLYSLCSRRGVSAKIDTSGVSIGRRYARMDELGAPFAVTVDFDSLKDKSVTLRERDSMAQVRLPYADVAGVCEDLSHKIMTWDDVVKKYPAFAGQES